VAEVGDGVVYLAIALRNVGNGLAVLDRWDFAVGRTREPHRDPADFRRLTRDLYVPSGDRGFWQGAFRDGDDQVLAAAAQAIRGREAMTVDLLYGDHEGGQRMVTRIALLPTPDEGWLASVSRHWNLDRDDPR
jgi:hypothetical protein